MPDPAGPRLSRYLSVNSSARLSSIPGTPVCGLQEPLGHVSLSERYCPEQDFLLQNPYQCQRQIF